MGFGWTRRFSQHGVDVVDVDNFAKKNRRGSYMGSLDSVLFVDQNGRERGKRVRATVSFFVFVFFFRKVPVPLAKIR